MNFEPTRLRAERMTQAVIVLVLYVVLAACQSTPMPSEAADQLLDATQRADLAALDEETPRGGSLKVYASDPGAPKILVEAPDITRPLEQPFAIRLQFVAEAGTEVDPDTFRLFVVQFGTLFDVTDKARKYLSISATGANAERAPQIPKGRRRLLVEITDDMRRTARMPLDLYIVK